MALWEVEVPEEEELEDEPEDEPEDELPEVEVWEVCVSVGKGAAVLDEVDGLALVVKALNSSVLLALSPQAK